MSDHAAWTAPAPFWQQFAASQDYASFGKPMLLRFATDAFMEDLETLLGSEPERLGEYLAVPETWRVPAGRPEPAKALPGFLRKLQAKSPARLIKSNSSVAALSEEQAALPLKLYQPAHQRFYLAAGCLVCRVPGMPNRTPDPGAGEKAAFVLRRLEGTPGAFTREYAYVKEASGSRWVEVSEGKLAFGEEQNPLPAMTFRQSDGRQRKLSVGFIPVGRRMEYLSLPVKGAANVPAPEDPRIVRLQMDFTGHWREIFKQAEQASAAAAAAESAVASANIISAANLQIQQSSWFALLGLADYLKVHAKHFWPILIDQDPVSALTDAEEILYQKLDASKYTDSLGVQRSFRTALKLIDQQRGKLETVTGAYTGTSSGWPSFEFKFASASTGTGALSPAMGFVQLENLVKAILPDQPWAPVPEPPAAAVMRAEPGDVWFQIRFVFERPNCGAIHPPMLSDASQPFLMASFFDPDAPARPVRIELPLDTTPAGLRKFDKNSAFLISDILCGQMKKLDGLTFGDLIRTVLPAPLQKNLPGGGDEPCTDSGGLKIGWICSLSIPIITICAFILLIIMVKLFDIIFGWMAFFRVCFPAPGLFGKKE